MSLSSLASRIAETRPLPDSLTNIGIRMMVGRTKQILNAPDAMPDARFAAEMARFPIAEHTDAANTQHYELPPEFFGLVLGPRRKYSCCLYEGGAKTLAEAEDKALAETALHADLRDGQQILELGCGWGSLSLWMAETLPNARITAVSNSTPQRLYIEGEAARRGFRNLRVITADMNSFDIDGGFDRVVSVEMFEHMANWRALLEKVRRWVKPDGRVFIHIFTHRNAAYRFDHNDQSDWIARHFFTGGIMPSHGLMRCFPDLFHVEEDWVWNGVNYQKTALDWLALMDDNSAETRKVIERTYGPQAMIWYRRWRLFFLATAGLFGHSGGTEWAVSHYRLAPSH